MWDICIYGKQDQEALLAAEILVAAAVSEGKYGKAIPCFGIEQSNYLQKVIVRIADHYIKGSVMESSQGVLVDIPQCVILLDPNIINMIDFSQILREKGVVIINEAKMAHELTLPEAVTNFSLVDAFGIARDVLGNSDVSTAMLGACAKTTGLIRLCSITENLVGYFPSSMLVKHQLAVRQGYESTTVVEIGSDRKGGSSFG